MDDIFELELTTDIAQDNSYIISYPHIVAHFASIKDFKESDLVVCSHIVYGWMPTALDLYVGEENISLDDTANLLYKAKDGELLTELELTNLSKVVNNSLVGVSKLLHFANPTKYPIWDSKIYRFVHNEAPYNYRVNKPKKYTDFIELLERLVKNQHFADFHSSVNKKLGYVVSSIRAIELVMFLNSNKYSG